MRKWQTARSLSPRPLSLWLPLAAIERSDHEGKKAKGSKSLSLCGYIALAIVTLLILTSTAAGRYWKASTHEPKQPHINQNRIASGKSPFQADAPGGFKDGELLIKFKRHVSTDMKRDLLARHKAKIIRVLYQSDVELWQIPKGQELAISQQLSINPSIEYAEPNYRYYALSTIPNESSLARLRPYTTTIRAPLPATIPNDPSFSKQWAHWIILSSEGWDIATGSSGIIIAIIDTGIDEAHPDLASKLVVGYDFVDDDSEPLDENGHGTHVAGIAAAMTNNGTGIAGMDWQARIMPVRVLDAQGIGYSSDITEGIHWAYVNGAKVLNLGLGNPTYSQSMEDAVNAAGSLVVAAMGDRRQQGNPTMYPAAYASVMAVAATNPSDMYTTGSQFGPHCDISAPGGDMASYHDPNGIYSTMPTYPVYLTTHDSCYTNYDYLHGTSQATAHVAGLAALVWSANPTLTPNEVQAAIESTAEDLGPPGWDPDYGHGRINVFASLGSGSSPIAPTLLAISNPDGNEDYLVDWSDVLEAITYTLEEDDDSDFASPSTRYSGTDSHFSVSGQQGGTWYYRVKAVSTLGDSPWSNIESATVSLITFTASATAGNNRIFIDWETATENGIRGFNLYRAEATSGPQTQLNGSLIPSQNPGSPTGASYRWSDQSVIPDITYYYWLEIVDIHGGSVRYGPVTAILPLTPLASPILYAIDNPNGDDYYTVDWSDVNEATEYILEEDSNTSFSNPTIRYTGPNSQYPISEKPTGTWYYRVRASDTSRHSPWSNVQSASVIARVYLPLTLHNYINFFEGPWEVEPNDDARTQANGPIVSGRIYYGTFLNNTDERDYFYFDLTAPHTVEIWLTNIPSGNDYHLALRDANLDIVENGYSADPGGDHVLTNVLPPGRYYIHVIHDLEAGSGSSQEYHLQAVFEE